MRNLLLVLIVMFGLIACASQSKSASSGDSMAVAAIELPDIAPYDDEPIPDLDAPATE